MTEPKRAPKGSVGRVIVLRLPPALHRVIKSAAKKEGLSVAEWLRRTIAARPDNGWRLR